MSLKATKNIFIDTILDTSGNEIQKLREVDEDLYDKTRGFMNMVNDIINNKLETGKKVKQIEQKITEPIKVEEEADLSFLDELDDVFSDDFLQQIDDTF
jgi:predicted transcriptional regulator